MLALVARRGAAPAPRADTRFDVIVPAHDEEAGIAETVRSLLAIAYPPERFRVIVVADNCTDATAERARSAGARVMERVDPVHRGKGYALAAAFDASASEGFADAVVVVDADTVVTPNLLGAFAARIARGAEAMQAEYGVRNATASWRTRLIVIAFALFHTTRSLARERLRLSCGLRGNGMCFTHALLRRVPHRAASIVEDIEFGVALGLAGVRVAYVDEAEVLGEMPAQASAARTQRERWEGGRAALARAHVPTLLRHGVERRDRVALDLAADLLVPPLTWLALASLGGTMVSLYVAHRGGSIAVPAAWIVSLVALAIYIARGVQLSGLGARAVLDLAWAPGYALWKLALLFTPRRRRTTEWVRTARGGDA
ncbi:MAG: glycosyltransferase [Gemmatimonadaceae bacterium]|nr:glycosyltransferase [Gemmatimonadaceae bacterium]